MEGQNKKRFGLILALVGAGLFVLGILAFSGKLGGNNRSSTAPEGLVNIWGTIPETQVSTALELINTKQNKIGVNYTYVSSETLRTRLAEAIALDVAPDIIISSTSDFYNIRSYTQPIPFTSYPEASFRQTFASIAGDMVQPGGILAIPLTIDPMVMFYNRDILAANGYATPPKLWSEVLSMAPEIIKLEQGQVLRQELLPFGQYKNVNNAWAILSTLFLQSRIPIASISDVTGKQVNLITPDSGNSTGNDVAQFFTQFSDPASEFYTWNRSFTDSKKEFVEGRLAFYPSFASDAQDLRDRNPNLNFAVSPMPQLNDDLRFQTTFANLYVASLNRKLLNSPAAYSILFEFINSDFQKTLAQNALMAPSTAADLMQPPETTYLPVVYKSAIVARSWYNNNIKQTQEAFSQLIENIITGKMGVQEALSQAESVLSSTNF